LFAEGFFPRAAGGIGLVEWQKAGEVGRKAGWTKSDEKLQEQYASVIKQLKKGYPIRMIAKNEGVGISTVQRMKKKFVDVG
jgi:DNA invertase Pin-like site-specific DNA recombinase